MCSLFREDRALTLLKKILAVETSCDETAVAILQGFDNILFSRIASQANFHAQYGGVVPEVAARSHLEILPVLVEQAFYESSVSSEEVHLYAATIGPGLPSALTVGASLTWGLAMGSERPFVPINHIEGHMLSPFFGEACIAPHIALVVSGGHTLLFDIQEFGKYKLLGRTLDDAAGEAFDKVARFLGLTYPGGAKIDALAKQGNASRYNFPRSMLGSGNLNFSFSGLKTAVRILLEKENGQSSVPDLCASFQEAVVDVLVTKTLRAAQAHRRSLIAMSGGVSANSRLQAKMQYACGITNIELCVAKPELQTDNALMIAFTAAHRNALGLTDTRHHYKLFPQFDLSTLCSVQSR